MLRQSDGIGRHDGLKNRCSEEHGGSNPSSGILYMRLRGFDLKGEKPMKRRYGSSVIDVNANIELVERMSTITEELQELLEISKGNRPAIPTFISKREIEDIVNKRISVSLGKAPKSLLSIFRQLIIRGVSKGRFCSTMYLFGKHIGINIQLKTADDFIKMVKKIGLGKITVEGFDPDDIRIRSYGGISCLDIRNSSRPICFFEAGLFSGILENVFRRNIELIEIRCIGKGDPYCYFRLKSLDEKKVPFNGVYKSGDYPRENLKLLTSLAAHSISAIQNVMMFEETRRQVVIDGLTKVYNHRYFQTQMAIEWSRAQRYRTNLCLLMLDIDNFKRFNDRYGHPRGDDILRAVATILVKNVRIADTVARYGGDEFAIILPQIDKKGAITVATRLQKDVARKKFMVRKKATSVTISIGGMILPPSRLVGKASDMIDVADKALLQAKKRGRNSTILIGKC